MTKELTENNCMEVLLRAALLLDDMHRSVTVYEITISGFLICTHVRRLHPRCKITDSAEYPYDPLKRFYPNRPARINSSSIPSETSDMLNLSGKAVCLLFLFLLILLRSQAIWRYLLR